MSFPEPLAYKRIEHTIDAGFGVEQVYELPFVLMDVTAKKVVSYLTNRTLYSNKFLSGSGDLSWRDVRKGQIVTLTAPRRNITSVDYLAHQVRFDGRGRHQVTLRPYDSRVYNDVALSTPTAWTPTSGYGSLYEVPYVTVSPTAGEGMFTTIADALANLPDWARRVVLLRGTHTTAAGTYHAITTAKGLDIIGESKEDVIVQNAAGQDLFVIYNSTKKYRFANFTIQSQNAAAGTNMVKVYGSAAANNTSHVLLDNLAFSFAHEDDYGVYANLGESGGLTVQSCSAVGASSGKGRLAKATYYQNVVVKDNYSKNLYAMIYVGNSTGVHILNNFGRDFSVYGIYVTASSGNVEDLHVLGNNLKTSIASAYYGIYVLAALEFEIMANLVKMDVNVSATNPWGITIYDSFDGILSNNKVKLANASATAYNYGFVLHGTSARNVVQGNHADLVNNRNATAKDYGFFLAATTGGNNRGQDNISYRAGIDLQDGAANVVTVTGI